MSLGSLHSASEAAASAAQLRSEAEAANLRKAAAGARKSSRAQQGVGGDGESSFRVPSSRFAPVVKTASHPAASDPSDHGFPHLPPSHRPSRPSTSPPPRPPPDRSGITGPPVGVRHRVQEVLRHVATAEEQRVFDGYQERVVELPRKYRAERKADGGGAVDATANVHGNGGKGKPHPYPTPASILTPTPQPALPSTPVPTPRQPTPSPHPSTPSTWSPSPAPTLSTRNSPAPRPGTSACRTSSPSARRRARSAKSAGR
ncbi:hypothetical protein EJ03DRAFT_326835 [Teratosphaeria nubilosa]|uniref:Uncharacterized protein n=1 Tax=Teratosphaeria nubilosa TaxID=161662 RepID=A0A6G1LBY0_9PEZI|nr:hypothetical protein EJ03DRAFT_326835 [Teratosphaeria nubilosa]